MTIHAVLLVPARGDPFGLLKSGPCGARPPRVSRCIACGKWGPWLAVCGSCHGGLAMEVDPVKDALVLAWEGEPVVEGCGRLAWVSGDYDEWGATFSDVEDILNGKDFRIGVDPRQFGTLIRLDEHGREVTR